MVWDSVEHTPAGALFPRDAMPDAVSGNRVGQCVLAGPVSKQEVLGGPGAFSARFWSRAPGRARPGARPASRSKATRSRRAATAQLDDSARADRHGAEVAWQSNAIGAGGRRAVVLSDRPHPFRSVVALARDAGICSTRYVEPEFDTLAFVVASLIRHPRSDLVDCASPETRTEKLAACSQFRPTVRHLIALAGRQPAVVETILREIGRVTLPEALDLTALKDPCRHSRE